MCLKIGDRVAVIDDVIKGYVFAIKNDLVTVKDDGDMCYQFQTKDLVKIDIDQHQMLFHNALNDRFLKEKTSSDKTPKKVFKKVKREVVMEVDLHISKLLKTTKGMDSYDMLNFQIETARKKIEYCIEKKISKIIFIHGVGEGVLKSELHFLLGKYPVKFYDASYKQYGLGATEVYVYQNI